MSYTLAIEGYHSFSIERPARIETAEKLENGELYWRILTTLMVHSVQSRQRTTSPARFSKTSPTTMSVAEDESFYLTALRSATVESDAMTREKEQRRSLTLDLICDFAEMMTDSDWNEECLKPTLRAQSELFALTDDAFRLLPMSLALSRPMLYPDGDGGLRLEWESGDRQIRLAIHRENGTHDYLYHQEGSQYALETPLTPTLLAGWLRWLLGLVK